MNNLTLVFLGLTLIYVPTCLCAGECFSQTLNPPYPCCKGNDVVYVDDNGYWGVENNAWCGISNRYFKDLSCFAIDQGYPCCEFCTVVYTDESGKWGVEDGKWCGIKNSCENGMKVDPVKNDTESDNEFEFSFLKMENNKKNMLYSPLSIKYALKMLQEGANGTTYDEISKVLGNAELPRYTSIDKYLSLANGLFIRDTYFDDIKPSYLTTLKEKYNAEVIKDEFKSAQNANNWIEEKTLGIIKNMLMDDIVQDPNNVMLIINALAIEMEWVFRFSGEKTDGDLFFGEDNQEKIVTMMHNKEVINKNVAYYKDSDITALSMDLKEYSGIQFEFMAIMPKENLSDYIEKVTKEEIRQIDEKLILSYDEPYGINVKIPKFKFSYNLDLKKDLKILGIHTIFNSFNADFTKMANITTTSLYVSDALHKADIEFTEAGVKAAAVTVFSMAWGAMVPIIKKSVDVVINRPFMFIIRDKNTKDIWFTGTVYEPNLWENDKKLYEKSYK